MFESHYSGTINISDYWSVGDIRTVSISAIESGTTSEAQDAQDINLIIIGLDHDDLSTTNGTRTKAAITVQTKNCFSVEGYMNSSNSGWSNALWSTSRRYSWHTSRLIPALPSYLQNLLKLVNKYNNTFCDKSCSGYSDYRTHESSSYSCFLLSEWEVFGKQNLSSSTYGSLDADGTQYEYMMTNSNRIKYLGVDGTTANAWWTRTGYVYGSSKYARFIVCGADGSYTYKSANESTGIAPAFCL